MTSRSSPFSPPQPTSALSRRLTEVRFLCPVRLVDALDLSTVPVCMYAHVLRQPVSHTPYAFVHTSLFPCVQPPKVEQHRRIALKPLCSKVVRVCSLDVVGEGAPPTRSTSRATLT